MEKKWKLNRHQKSDQAQGFWLWMTGDHELFMTAQKEFDWFPLEHTETCFSCLTLSFLLRHLAQLCPSRWGHVLFPSPCQPCCLLENLTPRYLTPSTTFWTPSHSTCSQEIYACAPVWGMFENQAAIMPAIELCGGWVTAKRLSQFMGNVSSVKWKMNSKTNRQSHLLLQFPGHDYKRRESRFFHKSHTHTCLHTHINTHQRALIVLGHDPFVHPSSLQTAPDGKRENLCADTCTCVVCVCMSVCFQMLLAAVSYPWLASRHQTSICWAVMTCTSTGGQANSGTMTALCWHAIHWNINASCSSERRCQCISLTHRGEAAQVNVSQTVGLNVDTLRGVCYKIR